MKSSSTDMSTVPRRRTHAYSRSDRRRTSSLLRANLGRLIRDFATGSRSTVRCLPHNSSTSLPTSWTILSRRRLRMARTARCWSDAATPRRGKRRPEARRRPPSTGGRCSGRSGTVALTAGQLHLDADRPGERVDLPLPRELIADRPVPATWAKGRRRERSAWSSRSRRG